MVILWIGVLFGLIIDCLVFFGDVCYVQFEIYFNCFEMCGVCFFVLDWFYVEGL